MKTTAKRQTGFRDSSSSPVVRSVAANDRPNCCWENENEPEKATEQLTWLTFSLVSYFVNFLLHSIAFSTHNSSTQVIRSQSWALKKRGVVMKVMWLALVKAVKVTCCCVTALKLRDLWCWITSVPHMFPLLQKVWKCRNATCIKSDKDFPLLSSWIDFSC